MRTKLSALFLAVLTAITLLAVPVSAESAAPAFRLTEMPVSVNGQSFALPMSVADFKAAGLPLPELNMLAEGTYYPSVGVKLSDDVSFSARVSYCAATPDEMWVNGVTLSADNCSGASIGDFVIGETTRGQVTDALGADVNGNTDAADLTYYAYHINLIWLLTFESASADAPLTRVTAYDELIHEYGVEFSDLAGVQDDQLPEPSALNWNEFILDGKFYAPGTSLQDLMDDGWALERRIDPAKEIAAPRDIWVHGEALDLYNGKTMAHVSVYNYSEGASPLNQCTVETVSVETEDNTVLLISGGLQAGVSTLADVEALLGAAVKSEENVDGTVSYEFEAMDGQVTVTATDDGDGLIDELALSGVNR